jgi:hypothetical protein
VLKCLADFPYFGHSTWQYPDIPGIASFHGKLMHSACWDNDYELEGKTVAVVGGGSSAVQIIPSIQPRVKKLIPYLRSPIWITAGFGAKYAAPGGVNFQCTYISRPRYRLADLICRLRGPKRPVQED